ncbi:deleted in malignant brain tumors 1 protein-like [Mytilus californianus]|uniref:deleted in malignant brain tumors 1 protein-like n=1 Tax=Mytilus californianus TaxID=6549 RepID=UPI002246B40B|nr:deleted in malignant brain tumors 1 protein-like [Mytilus californianus]
MGDIGKATYIDRDYNFSRSMFNVYCTGNETDLSECTYDTSDSMGMCDYVQDAGVHCIDTVAGNISVFVGSDGRVLLYNADTYNTSSICSYNWNDQDATVVCKQTGMGDIGKATYIDRDYNFSRSMFNVYCTGNETDLSECTYDTSDSVGMCDNVQDAGVHCIDTDQTQLVLGPDGRILFYNTQTGDISTVCSYMWNDQGADVVCRQLGMGDSGTAVYLPRDHNYTRNMYSVECMGGEKNMYDCNYQVTDYSGSCEYVSDAGVECASQVAGNISVFVGSDGRVLLYNAYTYNTSSICSYNWNDQDATVVCKQTGMGDIGKATYIDRDYNFSRSMFNVYCTGNETDLSECTYDTSDSVGMCDYVQDAGVHCIDTVAGNISVFVGSDGRVLLYNADTYNTSSICSYNWNDQDATVVCKQTGMGDIGKATYIDRDYNFSRSMFNVYCTGNETDLSECTYDTSDSVGMCDNVQDAGVHCIDTDQTQLVLGPDGRILFYNTQTGDISTVCSYMWNDQGADVVCRQLGMGDSGTAVYLPRDHNYTRNMYSVECMGGEKNMYDCNYQVTDFSGSCEYVSDAGVECASQVAGNISVFVGSDGRVLLYNADTYNTSSICSYNWNDQDATVVCKQTGMGDIGKATYIDRDYNFSRSMFNVYCTGNETDLSECTYDTSDSMGMCDYVQDAGVHCIDTVAGNISVFVGSDGRVLLYNVDTYNTSSVCSYNWNDQDATVVCKQTGMGDIGKATYIDRDYNFSRSMFNVYCTGNETDLSECTYDTSDSVGMCDNVQDAGVHCIDTDQTQLVLGPDGRILFYNTQTGDISTVCSYMWNDQGADVVCRQLGMGDSGTAVYLPRDHNYTRNMYSVECMGGEKNMYDCNYQVTDYSGSCEYVSDAGVECASQVAGNISVFVGSDGRVLLYNVDTYNTSSICSYNWNDQDATVVCKQTGMGDIGKATYIDRDYNFSRSMFNVYCTGNETDLSECTYDTSDSMGMCDNVQDAGVHCIDTDQTQLVLGPDGRILFYNTQTGDISTVCSYMWNDQGADVVCRQLGMGDSGTAVYLPRDHNYTRNMYSVECMGGEKNMYDCNYQVTDYSGSCEYVSDAGVECASQVAGNISVFVGSDGRVLLYNVDTYNTSSICSYNWNDQDATVVCKQTGMGDIGKATYIDRDYNFSRSMFNVYCTGNETDLSECTYDTSDSVGMCDNVQDAGVHCIDTDQTQLVLGPDGRILFYNTQTGDISTVCSYMWNDQGADVVCRQLGMGDSGTAVYLPRDHNYTRNMYSVECMGGEKNMYDCNYQVTDYSGSCEYVSDAGVECASQVAGNISVFVGSDGRVLLYNVDTYNTSSICSYNWNDQDATVVCKQTGMGDIGKATYIDRDYNFSRSMFNVYCTGNETDLSECTYDTSDSMGMCDYVQDAGVHCIDTDQTQLVLGPDGRILFYNTQTGDISTVCSYMWNDQGAGVVCRQLGMGDSGTAVYLPRDHNYTRNMYSVECMGGEKNMYDCNYQVTDYSGSCEYVSDAGVECASQVAGNISVFVGSDGRVLLYNVDTYNTSSICSYNWNDQDATVVCKQTGMGDIGKATYIDRDYNFSRSMFNVYCTGNETDLSECTYDTSDSMGMCDNVQDAGVHCIDTDQTQLVLGPDGRILFYNTQTGDISTVCSYMWNDQGADVVCRQLGMGDSGTAVYLPRDHNYTRNMYSVECMGGEKNMYDCNYQVTDYSGSCEHVSDAGVECASQVAGNISVFVGSDGRVLLYNADTYNTSSICSYNWNDQDATVVCKQTGMGDIGKATYIDRDYNFSRSIFNVYCTGNETDLSECTYDTSDSMGMCDYVQDAGVHCIDTDSTSSMSTEVNSNGYVSITENTLALEPTSEPSL